jgi:hypothetical protein
VFTTFASNGQDYPVGGDEGKWMWMARIANSSRTVRELYAPEWPEWEYNEWGPGLQNNTFGYSNSTTGTFQWNAAGQNTTIYKLMENAKSSQISGYPAPQLTYFKNPHFFGGQVATLGTTQTTQGTVTVYLDALVCLYEIDYAKYDLEH